MCPIAVQPNPAASLCEREGFSSVGCPVAARQELLRSAHHYQVQTSLALSLRFPGCVFYPPSSHGWGLLH